MRQTTKIWLGIHHIGKRDEEPMMLETNPKDAIRLIAQYIASVSMATRIEIKIGRSQGDIALEKTTLLTPTLLSELDAMDFS